MDKIKFIKLPWHSVALQRFSTDETFGLKGTINASQQTYAQSQKRTGKDSLRPIITLPLLILSRFL